MIDEVYIMIYIYSMGVEKIWRYETGIAWLDFCAIYENLHSLQNGRAGAENIKYIKPRR